MLFLSVGRLPESHGRNVTNSPMRTVVEVVPKPQVHRQLAADLPVVLHPPRINLAVHVVGHVADGHAVVAEERRHRVPLPGRRVFPDRQQLLEVGWRPRRGRELAVAEIAPSLGHRVLDEVHAHLDIVPSARIEGGREVVADLVVLLTRALRVVGRRANRVAREQDGRRAALDLAAAGHALENRRGVWRTTGGTVPHPASGSSV